MNKSGIIWLASYPRSGNTWVRVLLANALAGDRETVDLNRLPFGSSAFSRELIDDILGLETSELPLEKVNALWPRTCSQIAETLAPPRFSKTHARCPTHRAERDFLKKGTAGVVLIVRHPVQVANSLAKFLNVSSTEAIAIMADEQYHITQPIGGILENLPQWVGSWSSHLNSWLDADFRLLLVRYEDILANPHRELSRILSFAEIDRTSSEIVRAVENSRMDRLRVFESLHGFREAPRTPAPFFRSGEGVPTEASIPEDQAEILTRDHGAAMARFHYE